MARFQKRDPTRCPQRGTGTEGRAAGRVRRAGKGTDRGSDSLTHVPAGCRDPDSQWELRAPPRPRTPPPGEFKDRPIGREEQRCGGETRGLRAVPVRGLMPPTLDCRHAREEGRSLDPGPAPDLPRRLWYWRRGGACRVTCMHAEMGKLLI